MPTTMQLIAKQTVGSGGAASVTFSNIPQTFTDLKVVMSTRSSGTSSVGIRFNGSSSNLSNIRLYSNGSVTASYGGSDVFAYQNRGSYTANTFDNSEIYIPNYTSSNFKSMSMDNVTETMSGTAEMQLQAGLWSQTAAITSLGFFPDSSQTLTEFTEITLYGISSNTTTQASTVPYASGGDVITTDGSFWYHTFLYSGTFTPLKNLTCDYLVVAGGGAGGYEYSGGGGAGGYRTSIGGTALSLTAQSYTATVGAGGTAPSGVGVYSTNSTSGNNSVFSTITSSGGGRGGSRTVNNNASAGGSGGGGSTNSSGLGGTGNAGSYSPVEGYAGANGSGSNTGGGGGGSSAAATNINGANGTANSITGTSVTYAGGGGGGIGSGTAGTGGTGGGGAGGTGGSGNGTAGTANTGGGGGGAGEWAGPSLSGGNGGSGIIIVRYAV
jgi:hypothetical protein